MSLFQTHVHLNGFLYIFAATLHATAVNQKTGNRFMKEEGLFMLDSKSAGHHTLIFGTSGIGRSSILADEAKRQGISYEEMVQRSQPTPEQVAKQQEREAKARQDREKRLSAVRDAYWSNTPASFSDAAILHDLLVSTKVFDSPTPDQIKSFFMMLPSGIVGGVIEWGMSDTEIRDRIYEYIEQNKEAVLTQLQIA